MIQRYLPFLQQRFKKENDQYTLLDSLKRAWVNSKFHQVTLIDELMSYKLLNFRMIINWVFLEIEKGVEQTDHCKIYWEILLNVILKMLGRSDAVKTELRKVLFFLSFFWEEDDMGKIFCIKLLTCNFYHLFSPPFRPR